MGNVKNILKTAAIDAVIMALAGYWIFEGDWPFLPWLLLAGVTLAFIHKESKAHKYLPGLMIGSLVFGLLTMIFVFLRMYVFSHFFYDSSLPFSFLFNPEWGIMAAVFAAAAFLGGLMGIALKGFYSLYKNKLDYALLLLGPALLTLASVSIARIKYGGTILSTLSGWPYYFITYRVKDIIDNFRIDERSFTPGSLYHNIILDYLFFLVILVLVYLLMRAVSGRWNAVKTHTTFVLSGLVVAGLIAMMSYLPARQSYISRQIARAGNCATDAECVIVGNKCPFSCAVVANRNEADRITRLVNLFPSTCELSCPGNNRAVCLNGSCRVADQETADNGLDSRNGNNIAWLRIIQAISNCEAVRLFQAHSLRVQAQLKDGSELEATEPVIDEIFRVAETAEEKCGHIPVATE